jgi:DNA-binding protein HU-beta
MNKADLVNLVAARTELTKTDVSLVVDAAIDTIIDSVVEGKKSFDPWFRIFRATRAFCASGAQPKNRRKDQDSSEACSCVYCWQNV